MDTEKASQCDAQQQAVSKSDSGLLWAGDFRPRRRTSTAAPAVHPAQHGQGVLLNLVPSISVITSIPRKKGARPPSGAR
eukprot:1837819-Pyramimonas_sp.AAC.1